MLDQCQKCFGNTLDQQHFVEAMQRFHVRNCFLLFSADIYPKEQHHVEGDILMRETIQKYFSTVILTSPRFKDHVTKLHLVFQSFNNTLEDYV